MNVGRRMENNNNYKIVHGGLLRDTTLVVYLESHEVLIFSFYGKLASYTMSWLTPLIYDKIELMQKMNGIW